MKKWLDEYVFVPKVSIFELHFMQLAIIACLLTDITWTFVIIWFVSIVAFSYAMSYYQRKNRKYVLHAFVNWWTRKQNIP